MSEFKEYDHAEIVKARKLSDDGEAIMTTVHGGVTVYGGYYVKRDNGVNEYWDTEPFETYWEEIPVEEVDGIPLKEK